MKKLVFVFLMLIVITLLVACSRPTVESGTRPTTSPSSSTSPLPTAPVSPISPLPVPPLAADKAADEALAALRAEVAEQLDVADKALMIVAAEQVTWPDASLGCPQPDIAYAQVLTPGWRVVFMDDKGRKYDVHTTENHERVVICESPAEPDTTSADQVDPAVAAAIKTLVEQEDVAAESVQVISVAAVEWPNSCLGCEKRGQYCLMVVTPGYRIVLESGSETHVVHTDRAGKQVIICTHPSLTPPAADS